MRKKIGNILGLLGLASVGLASARLVSAQHTTPTPMPLEDEDLEIKNRIAFDYFPKTYLGKNRSTKPKFDFQRKRKAERTARISRNINHRRNG